MEMAYTMNPHLPKLRMEAVRLVKYRGWSTRQVARYTGFSQASIVQWCKKDPTGGWHRIETKSSRPHSHAKQLSPEIVEAIVTQRKTRNRCAEVVHQELLNQGVSVSLSSVKRTLDRKGLTKKRSPWKRSHPHVDRPDVINPGDLVELDTIHLMTGKKERIYVIPLIDLYSRWTYAKACERLTSIATFRFVQEAEDRAGFKFNMLQSDHGPEFSSFFVRMVRTDHRYSRIGKPNDNSHIERFNRTLQEECLDGIPREVKTINQELKKYLKYYNNERLHMGINLKTPAEVITRY
jgi:transposase InsO family protein